MSPLGKMLLLIVSGILLLIVAGLLMVGLMFFTMPQY